MNIDKAKFWENKIIDWENQRYKLSANSKIGSYIGSPLQFRIQNAAQILTPHLSGKKLLELGCGSGLLREALGNSGLEKYTGIDWASSAIDKANARYQINEDLPPAEFFVGNFIDMDLPDFDVVVALGVLDWLEINEINTLFAKIKPKPFLFSISEHSYSLNRLLHLVYVYFSYGWKNKGYIPRYYKTDEIKILAQQQGYANIKVFRDRQMSFGTLLYQLD